MSPRARRDDGMFALTLAVDFFDALPAAAACRELLSAVEASAQCDMVRDADFAGVAALLTADAERRWPWRCVRAVASKLTCWLRADRGVEMDAAGLVHKWHGGRDAVAAAPRGPLSSPHIADGGLVFTTAAGAAANGGAAPKRLHLRLPAPLGRAGLLSVVAAARGDTTILDVFTPAAAGDGRGHFELCHGYPGPRDAEPERPRVALFGSGQLRGLVILSPATVMYGAMRPDGKRHVYTLIHSPAPNSAHLDVALYVDGALEVAGRVRADALAGQTHVCLGGAANGSFKLDGALFDVVAWPFRPSNDVRRALEAALRERHGIPAAEPRAPESDEDDSDDDAAPYGDEEDAPYDDDDAPYYHTHDGTSDDDVAGLLEASGMPLM
ncbi:hypothetical protein M885DRAFT_621012 [Pelagophyceae sp. CCMP2097]|nr:hypothetical protein M885DRAFT_621012 [Pelagophyceae sp. CCMP2097]